MYPGAYAAETPDRPALIMGTSGQTQTFGELDARANQISHLLRSKGVEVEDHVAMVLENSPHFSELLWGAHYAGTYYTAVSSRLGAEEIAYIVNDCGAKVLFLSSRYADKADEVRDQTPGVELYVSVGDDIGGYEPLESLLEGQSTEPLPDRIGGRDMLYSSGTTGKPKGIRQPDLNDGVDAPLIITPVLQKIFGMGPDDVYLSPAPNYHAAPLRFAMTAQQLGATVVMMERFDERQLLELIEKHGVTLTQVVPTMFVRMLRLPREDRDAADTSSLKGVIHAGAPCPPQVKHQMIDWWGEKIHEYYASTEGVGVTWVTSTEWLAHEGSVGRALIGTVRIVDDEGSEVAAGETGNVFFSDGNDFEYHNDPEKTADAHNDQGWAGFGDIGHLDEDGFLYLTDRKAYTIISGGVNIYPQEAEDALISHEKVMDAAVFGVPDEEFGERVVAVVQPMEMPNDEESFAQELIDYTRSKLADVKCPRQVDFREELPRADTGKLYKRLLKDEYAERAAKAEA